jgi:vancomycin resistance protein VanJ
MIVIMTYNIGNGLASQAQLIPMLAESGADVIGLQEVSPDQGRALDRALRELYPHRALFPLGIAGKAILSKIPIREVELLELYSGRPDLRAVLDLPVRRRPLRIIVAHPPPPKMRQRLSQDAATREQLAQLVSHATAGEPTVMVGDFNAVAVQKTYRDIAGSGLIDAFKSAGRGAGETLPTRMAKWAYQGSRLGDVQLAPFMRVDYIWHTGHLRATSAWVGAHAGSDHLPVLASLEPAPAAGTAAEAEAILVPETPELALLTPPVQRLWWPGRGTRARRRRSRDHSTDD